MGAWKGDAVELVDAFRSGKSSPIEELENVFVALENSELNSFCLNGKSTHLFY